MANETTVLAVPFASDVSKAPVIFFDGAPSFGGFNNIIVLSVSVALQVPGSDGKTKIEQHVAAHLRTNIEGAKALRAAIDGALLAIQPVEGQTN